MSGREYYDDQQGQGEYGGGYGGEIGHYSLPLKTATAVYST